MSEHQIAGTLCGSHLYAEGKSLFLRPSPSLYQEKEEVKSLEVLTNEMAMT